MGQIVTMKHGDFWSMNMVKIPWRCESRATNRNGGSHPGLGLKSAMINVVTPCYAYHGITLQKVCPRKALHNIGMSWKNHIGQVRGAVQPSAKKARGTVMHRLLLPWKSHQNEGLCNWWGHKFMPVQIIVKTCQTWAFQSWFRWEKQPNYKVSQSHKAAESPNMADGRLSFGGLNI